MSRRTNWTFGRGARARRSLGSGGAFAISAGHAAPAVSLHWRDSGVCLPGIGRRSIGAPREGTAGVECGAPWQREAPGGGVSCARRSAITRVALGSQRGAGRRTSRRYQSCRGLVVAAAGGGKHARMHASCMHAEATCGGEKPTATTEGRRSGTAASANELDWLISTPSAGLLAARAARAARGPWHEARPGPLT